MESKRSGRPVANQFIIESAHHTIFQSYSTIIGAKDKESGEVCLDEDSWNYSPTTSKYRNQWLGITTKETKDRIASGKIKLYKLN